MKLLDYVQVFWPESKQKASFEEEFCTRFCYEIAKLVGCPINKYNIRTYKQEYVSDKKYVFFVKNPWIVIRPAVILALVEILETYPEYDVALPVYNHTNYDAQLAPLPFNYFDLATFDEVLSLMLNKPLTFKATQSSFDMDCILIKADLLNSFLRSSLTSDIHPVIHPGALVHKFFGYAAGERVDLVKWIPPGVSSVLDIGAGVGRNGAMFRQHLHSLKFLAAVEPNEEMAQKCKQYFDEVHVVAFEKWQPNRTFDVVWCTDVIEHMYDPWSSVEKMSFCLEKGGHLIISFPNVGHWSIIKSLSEGDFYYIPWGLLCVGHIRFFTLKSMVSLLTSGGFRIVEINKQQPIATPEGSKFIEILANVANCDIDSILTCQYDLLCVKV